MFKPDTFKVGKYDEWDLHVAKRMHDLTRERLGLDAEADPRMVIIDAVAKAPLCKITGALFAEQQDTTRPVEYEYDASGYRIVDEAHPLPACLVGAIAYVCWGATSDKHLKQIITAQMSKNEEDAERLAVPGQFWEASPIVYRYTRLVYGTEGTDLYYINDTTGLAYDGMVAFLRDFVGLANSDNETLWSAFMKRVNKATTKWAPLTPTGQELVKEDARRIQHGEFVPDRVDEDTGERTDSSGDPLED